MKIGLTIGTRDRHCGNCLYSRGGAFDVFVICDAYKFYPFKQLVCDKHNKSIIV